jgi:hypothetical protein
MAKARIAIAQILIGSSRNSFSLDSQEVNIAI